jgi:N-dimethylarginine dimethylaminohydrolase
MRELLLCPPDYYGIEYEINPWMSRARGAESELAKSQWEGLRQTLASLDSKIELVPPQPKLPDMVFTANAGLTVGKKFIPSNFRYPERAGEAPYFRRWMEEHGYETIWLPDNLYFEGEGDALFSNDTLFCGYKFRSDIQSHRAVGELLRCLVISVELVDPRFYHLDTCFCPLPDGSVFWFPNAFDEYGQRAIRAHVIVSGAASLILLPIKPKKLVRVISAMSDMADSVHAADMLMSGVLEGCRAA